MPTQKLAIYDLERNTAQAKATKRIATTHDRRYIDRSADMPELKYPPVNDEPDLHALISNFITPIDKAYRRNHCTFPDPIDPSTHRVQLDGLVSKTTNLSIQDLRSSYPQYEVTCALQCAGNRRHTMRTLLAEVQGLDWFDGAVMNCTWRGPLLRDVLLAAGLQPGLDEEEAQVAFACNALPCQEDYWYGASITLSRALRKDAEVVVALEMNGQPLPLEHGGPVRIVTPGIAGARAVKWLDHISVQREVSSNHYMHYDYKVLPPEAKDAESAKPFWAVTPPVIEMPVNSVVAVPAEGSTAQTDADGLLACRGYAVPSGDDGPVTRVEVSGDEGKTWAEATLVQGEGESKWSWKLWEARVAIEKGRGKTVWSRAVDKAGNEQPRHSQWNLRGVCYNGYGEARGLTVQ